VKLGLALFIRITTIIQKENKNRLVSAQPRVDVKITWREALSEQLEILGEGVPWSLRT
jgi:hypothetical protein